MYEIIDCRGGRTNIFKVKSHLEDEGPSAIRLNKITFVDLVGNALADAVAEEAAARIQPDQNQISSANWCDKIGVIVAKRQASA